MDIQPFKDTRYQLATRISLMVIFIFTILFLWLAKMVFLDQNMQLDNAAAAYAQASVSPKKTTFYSLITYLGSQQFLVPAYLLLLILFLLVRKLRRYSWRLLVTVILGTLMMFGIKYLFGRERPLDPLLAPAQGHSFPSGHSFSSLLFFGILLFIAFLSFQQKWKKILATMLLLGASVLVAISRVYLGVHFITDVLAGLSLAIIWIFLNELFLYRKLPLLLS